MGHEGLGVGDIYIRNASLLFKWWWRFADDQKPLWKDIVRSIHGPIINGDAQRVKGKCQTSLWGQINDFKRFGKEIEEVAKKGIQVKVGNGGQTKFWIDHWLGETSLKNSFPRLFMLSTQKDNFIEEMGEWDRGVWRWSFCWRRNFFVWEEDVFQELLRAVNRISLRENTSDEKLWFGLEATPFSVSNFVMQVTKLMGEESPYLAGRLAWRNIAPPRAQLHLWFMLQGRLNTKERLFKLGVTGVEDDRCTFCKENPETINHLFFSCKLSSSLWYHCCDQWNVALCLPNHPKDCLLSWLGTRLRKIDKQMWISMFYVISWSIWDIRNKITFHDFKPNWEFEKKRLFWRLGLWMRGWHPELPFSPDQVMDSFNDVRSWAHSRAIFGG